jgi:hypothetical protein
MVLRWNTMLIVVMLVCHTVLGAPNDRFKRSEDNVAGENSDLNPITYEVIDKFYNINILLMLQHSKK